MHLLVDGLNKVKEGRMSNIDLFGQEWNQRGRSLADTPRLLRVSEDLAFPSCPTATP